MARIITKELALKIVKKLKASKVDSLSKAHDLYAVEEFGIIFALISIRRSSDKEIGHDYLKNDLHVSPHQAKDLGQCPMSREEYIALMIQKGILPDRTDSSGS